MTKIKHIKLAPKGKELEEVFKRDPARASIAIPFLQFAEIITNAYIDVRNKHNEESNEGESQ